MMAIAKLKFVMNYPIQIFCCYYTFKILNINYQILWKTDRYFCYLIGHSYET